MQLIYIFYRFSVKNSSETYCDCPYNAIASKLLRIRANIKEIPNDQLLYIDIINEKNDAKLIELFQLMRNILTVDKYKYCDVALWDFNKQLGLVLKHEESKNNFPFFERNYEKIYDTCFDILKSTTQTKSINIAKELLFSLSREIAMKFKNMNNNHSFHLYLVKKFNDYLEFFLKIYESYDDKIKKSELVVYFLRDFIYVIREKFKDKSLKKPSFQFVVNIFEFCNIFV
jgi:hypothetical protein